MSELPEGWVETTLKEISSMGPKSEWDDNTNVGFVPMSHAPTSFLEVVRYDIRPWHEVKKAYTHFEDGDVIFAKVTPCFENGKAALVSGLPNGAGAGSSEFHVLRPLDHGVSAKYLLAIIRSAAFLRQGEASMTGAVGLRRVPRAFIEQFPAHLPPAAEQKRIIQKLDALLAQVEAIKARIDALPAMLKRFRKSVVAAAVSGKLTSSWRNGDNFFKLNRDDSSPHAAWQSVNLGQYAINHDGARRPISAQERQSQKGDIPYFGATGQIDSIDGYTHNGEFVLVGEDGANLLTRAKPIAFVAKGKIWVNNHAHVITCPNGHSNAYLAIYLNTIDITPWVSGSAQPKLNQRNMGEIPLCIPPIAEQVEIVRRVEKLLAFADRVETKLAATKQRIDTLTQSLLTKAFRGELVPQDPNDEPASVLLERIRAQRAAAPKPKRGRKAASN